MKKGDVYSSRAYGEFEILDNINSEKVIYRFKETGFVGEATRDNLRHGRVKDKLHKGVFGVGFMGVGKYNSKHRSYYIWSSMISRCYCPSNKCRKYYSGCSVCVEWHNYQNFAEWYSSQNAPKGYEIDKDIKLKGNRIYSPETCLMVSKEDNIKAKIANPDKNSTGYVGVVTCKYKNKTYYTARVTRDGKRFSVGNFSSAEDASKARLKYIADMERLAPSVFEKVGL